MPGALVAAKVEKVLSDGLILSFLSFFTGTVDHFHLAEVHAPAADTTHYSDYMAKTVTPLRLSELRKWLFCRLLGCLHESNLP